jgi:hypothetical protein
LYATRVERIKRVAAVAQITMRRPQTKSLKMFMGGAREGHCACYSTVVREKAKLPRQLSEFKEHKNMKGLVDRIGAAPATRKLPRSDAVRRMK